MAAVPASKSMTPIASRFRRTRSLSARRQQRADAPEREQPLARAELQDQREVHQHQRAA